MKRYLKIFSILLLAFVIISAITLLNINSIARSQINQALGSYLANGGSIDDINIDIKAGKIGITTFVVNPPVGYGDKPLLLLDELTLDINLQSLFTDEIIIEDITLNGAKLTLERNKHGDISASQLVQPTDEMLSTETTKTSATNIPAIRINSIALNNFAINIIDQLSEEPWEAELLLDLAVKNTQLKDILNLDISVGEISLAINDVSVDQPVGYSNTQLLTVGTISLTTSGFELGSSPIKISTLQVDSLKLAGERNIESELNLQKLLSAWQSKDESNKQAENPVAADTTLPTIIFEQIKIENSAITFQDNTQGTNEPPFSFINIGAETTHLSLFDNSTTATPASALVHFEVEQPNGHPNALFGGVATVGSLGNGIPMINSQVRLVGLKFDTLGTSVSNNIRTAMGASGLDAGFSLALDTDSINLLGELLTDQNIHYKALKVQGDIDTPEIEVHKVMAGFHRISKGLLNFSKDSLSAGLGIASGGVNIIKLVGFSVIKLGTGLGGSALDAGTGIVTLDSHQFSDGIGNFTSGTTKTTYDSFSELSKTTGDSLKESIHNLTGNATLNTWAKNIPERYQITMQQAEIDLESMPYPPVTE